jgi:hypothetical protein
MALSLSSPGISIKEVDLTTGSVNATSPLSAGIAGPFARGPVEEVVEIRTEKDLLNTFGPPSKENYHYEYWYSASNFLSYGGSLKVVRADSTNLKNANAAVGTASTSIKVKNFEDYQGQLSSTYYWAAKNPGYWAENIKVCVIDNFADQTFTGINTTGISVGNGITQVLSNGETLKGIVSGIGNSEFYVKITNKISAGGTETSQDYTERGIYSFSPSTSISINGSLAVGANSVSATRAGLGTFPAANIVSGNAFNFLNVVKTTSIDMSGNQNFLVGSDQLYLSDATGITTANYLQMGNFILSVASVANASAGNIQVNTAAVFGTTKATVADGTSVKVLSLNSNFGTFSVGVGTTATILELSTLGVGSTTITSGDYLINTVTSEIITVNAVSNAGTLLPTAVNDWYNTQYVLSTAAGDGQNILWKSIAPKPRSNQYVLERGGSNDALHVAVIDSKNSGNVSGTSQQILEVFRNLSKATDTMISPSENVFYKSYLAANSRYIYAGSELKTDSFWGVTESASRFSSGYTPISTSLGVFAQESSGVHFNSIGNKTFTITGGKDYSTAPNKATNVGGFEVSLGDINVSLEKLSNPNEVGLNFLLQGSASGSIEFEQSRANYLISIAENRKDCVAFISPYRSATVNVNQESTKLDNVIKFFSPLTSSSYAVFDSGYQYVYDRFNKEFIYMPCSADVAGLCVRTDINQHPWFSPAGKVRGTLKNVIKLSYNPNQDDRDELYSNRINPIINYPGSGVVLYGDKTALSYTSAFDRINVRRLFITIENAIRSAADAQLFEFNDAATRANFVNIVEPYLRDVQAKRGITDFLLVCDETNNTPDVIDRNEFIADIYVKPARSINFIGLTFIATRTGVSFETVVGTV